MHKIFLLIFLLNLYFLHIQANPLINRVRRDYESDFDSIWGMTKKVFYAVITAISACIICCIVTTIYLCIRCCCTNGGRRQKQQQQHLQASPQPIIITTSYPGYVPQSYQQQAPSPSPMWQLENHPMLPQPSAPPLPAESIYPDRPPSYEKAIAN